MVPHLFALAVALNLLMPAALADEVPRLDPAPSCRAAGQASAQGQNRLEKCLEQENAARDQIAKDWTQFDPAERASCVRLSQMGYKPTYTELLTCLEMARDVRNLPAGDQDRATTGVAR